MKMQALAAMMTISFGLMFAGDVEGYFFPVTKDSSITSVMEVSKFEVEIMGSFTKQRSCSFQGIEFQLESISTYSVAQVAFLEPNKVRQQGDHMFGPWRVQLKAEQLEEAVAYVYHQCAWRPWKTKTLLWP